MGDCQLDDLLDMLEEDDDAFVEATVDDPGSCENPGHVNDHVDEEEEEAEDDAEEEEMARKLREMEEKV